MKTRNLFNPLRGTRPSHIAPTNTQLCIPNVHFTACAVRQTTSPFLTPPLMHDQPPSSGIFSVAFHGPPPRATNLHRISSDGGTGKKLQCNRCRAETVSVLYDDAPLFLNGQCHSCDAAHTNAHIIHDAAQTFSVLHAMSVVQSPRRRGTCQTYCLPYPAALDLVGTPSLAAERSR